MTGVGQTCVFSEALTTQVENGAERGDAVGFMCRIHGVLVLIIPGYGAGLVKPLTPCYRFYTESVADSRDHTHPSRVYSVFRSLFHG